MREQEERRVCMPSGGRGGGRGGRRGGVDASGSGSELGVVGWASWVALAVALVLAIDLRAISWESRSRPLSRTAVEVSAYRAVAVLDRCGCGIQQRPAC